MPLQNDDLFLVNRGGNSFKTEYGLLKTSLKEDAHVTVGPTAPADPEEGRLWFNSTEEALYVYHVTETTGVVNTVGLRNAGSGYTTDQDNVSTTNASGHGVGLTLDIDAGVGGNFTNPQVNIGGYAYEVGDIVYVTGAGHGNGSVQVTDVVSEMTGNWIIANEEGFNQEAADARYLKLDASNDPVTGECEFKAGARITNASDTNDGRIVLSADDVTSTYEASIKANDTGLTFGAQSNTRGFVFQTGSPLSNKIEVDADGTTTFRERVNINNNLGGNDNLSLGTTAQASTNTSGIRLSSLVQNPTDQSPSLSFYVPVEAYEPDDELSSQNSIIQSIAGTAAEATANGGNRVVKFRMSKNGTLFAGSITAGAGAQAEISYEINGLTGDADFKKVSGTIGRFIGIDTTSSSNRVLDFGKTTGVYNDTYNGYTRNWYQLPQEPGVAVFGSRTSPKTESISFNAKKVDANGTPLMVFTPVESGAVAAGITDAVETVKSLLPNATGFDATQLQSVLPDAFATRTHYVDENTTESVTSYDQTKLVPILVKALQEALTRLDAIESNEILDDATDNALLSLVASLSARVTALEGGS